MKRNLLLGFALLAVLGGLVTVVTLAMQARRGATTPLVVDAAWLSQHIADEDLVLLHVGDEKGYLARHLPGARLVRLADISVSDHSGHGLMLEMPPADDLRGRLAALGISDDSRMVVYYGEDWISPATRVLFTLDYAGLGDRSGLLDGGMPAWVRAGHAVTDAVPPPRQGSLAPFTPRPIVVNAAFVRESRGLPGVAIVDARDRVFYDGADTGGSHDQAHRAGHIEGARSFPFTDVTDDRLVLRSPEELSALFAKAGVSPGDTVIGYCHIGQQATAMLFAARRLGHPVRLYDGSFEDWSLFHPDYPVESPPRSSPRKEQP